MSTLAISFSWLVIAPDPPVGFAGMFASLEFKALIGMVKRSTEVVTTDGNGTTFLTPRVHASPSDLAPPIVGGLSVGVWTPGELTLHRSSLIVTQVIAT